MTDFAECPAGEVDLPATPWSRALDAICVVVIVVFVGYFAKRLLFGPRILRVPRGIASIGVGSQLYAHWLSLQLTTVLLPFASVLVLRARRFGSGLRRAVALYGAWVIVAASAALAAFLLGQLLGDSSHWLLELRNLVLLGLFSWLILIPLATLPASLYVYEAKAPHAMRLIALTCVLLGLGLQPLPSILIFAVAIAWLFVRGRAGRQPSVAA